MEQPEEEVWMGICWCLVDVPAITIVLCSPHYRQDKNVILHDCFESCFLRQKCKLIDGFNTD